MIEETIDWLLTKRPSHVALGMVDDAERIFGRNSNRSSAKVLISENPNCKLEMISLISEEFTDIMQVLASSSSHCVTGRIISGGPNYDSLAQRWTLEGNLNC